MKSKEIVQRLKTTNPKLSSIPDGKAAALLREAFMLINEEVAQTSDGVVAIPSLGRFRVKSVEREKDGEKTTVNRVLFRPAKKRDRPALEKAD